MERLKFKFFLFIMLFLFVCLVAGEKIEDLESKVEGLENLVEYHSSNYYELLDENFALKEHLQKAGE